jgi:ABC-type branched-subunit amino acid transport system ATPase component/ABC-type branched-subunit amino acid transport system permease subunit
LNGLGYGLLAVGLVLVYKSNRFLNLAHAQMGSLSALLMVRWVTDMGWNWWLAFVLSIAVGAITGVIVERVLIARLVRQGGSPVRLVLLSVAISQLLLALTFVPHIAPDSNRTLYFPQPFVSHVKVGGVALSGMSLLTAFTVPALVILLAAFLRYTFLGRAIRAAASNPESARLAGIPVAKVTSLTWAIAGALAGVSAILQAPNDPGFNLTSLGPYLLMLTLGAAAFGAFVSLPGALAGGIALGLISQFVSGETSSAADGELAVFVAVLAIVMIRGRSIARAFALSGGFSEGQSPTRVPAAMRSSPLIRYQRLWLSAAGFFVALVVPHLPYFDSAANRFLLQLILVYAILGVGLTMLMGWAGQVSLGHFALVGLGAYLTARWSPHWSLLAILLVAGVIGSAVMVVTGLPALRVGGLALAVTTMGFAVISADWLYHQSWVGSDLPFVAVSPVRFGRGLGSISTDLGLYYTALAVLVIGSAAAVALRKWGPARVMISVRDNELAASALGIQPATVKLTVLAVSGFYAAAAGVLWAQAWHSAAPVQFTSDISIAIIAIPVIGGLGSVGGAIAAAVLLYGITYFVGPHVSSLFGSFGQNIGFQLFIVGLGQVLVLLSYPRGIAGLVQTGWEHFLQRRSTVVAEWSPLAVEPSSRRHASAGVTDDESIPVSTVDTPVVADPLVVALQVTDITVHFGGVKALDGPDISVREGEIVGLIGPNGAGKSTLMNVISGVIRPDQGSVRIAGHEVAGLAPDFRAAFGMARTFQDARLFGGLSVRETVQVAMAFRNKVGTMSALVAAPWAQATELATQQKADEIIERFGLVPWADSLTSELSTGTRRVCDLAVQVAAEPNLLLLDEPTAGVAQREAEAFGPLLRRIRDELDCAILIVEHDMPLLMGLCDRIYAMETGQVIAEGTPTEIRNSPRVIASYLGSQEAAVNRSGRRTGRSAKRPVNAARKTNRRIQQEGVPAPGASPNGGSGRASSTKVLPTET